jgi:toxin secretion/phage lysis holin
MKAFSWKAIGAALVGIACQVWGAWDQLMTALVILMALDVVTGFLRAFIQQELSSKESFRGMAKKVLIFVLLAVAVQVDVLTGLNGTTRHLVAVFYCASEGLSILENSVAAGMPAPEVLRQALKQLNEGKFREGES